MKEYEFKQSKYEVAPRIPFSQIVVGPSGSGKSVLLQSMILDLYRDCFSRIFIFSSSINVDSVWTPVKDYIEKTLKIDSKKEKIYFNDFNPSDLEEILDLLEVRQQAVYQGANRSPLKDQVERSHGKGALIPTGYEPNAGHRRDAPETTCSWTTRWWCS